MAYLFEAGLEVGLEQVVHLLDLGVVDHILEVFGRQPRLVLILVTQEIFELSPLVLHQQAHLLEGLSFEGQQRRAESFLLDRMHEPHEKLVVAVLFLLVLPHKSIII